MADQPEGNWEQWRYHVLEELKRLSGNVDNLNANCSNCRTQLAGDIATLKAKSGFWGAVGGTIAGAVAVVITLLRGSK